jgi:hypothetical protein
MDNTVTSGAYMNVLPTQGGFMYLYPLLITLVIGAKVGAELGKKFARARGLDEQKWMWIGVGINFLAFFLIMIPKRTRQMTG